MWLMSAADISSSLGRSALKLAGCHSSGTAPITRDAPTAPAGPHRPQQVVALSESYARLREVTQVPERRWGLVDADVGTQARRVNAYHRKKLIQTFRTALGVDIRPLLNDTAISFPLDARRTAKDERLRPTHQANDG